MTGTTSKLARLRAAWDAGNRLEALRIAARFPRLGAERETITRGWAAYTNPGFYREMGRDPEALIAAAFDALAARYELDGARA